MTCKIKVNPIWNKDCFYQKELERIWSEYGHQPNIKESIFDWQSWNETEQTGEMETKK